jgi:hypothetical protein
MQSFIKTLPFMNMYGQFSDASERLWHEAFQCGGIVPLL